MILYGWRNTDPAFNVTTKLSTFPPKMVNSIQFDFDSAAKCEHSNCSRHAFIRCSHCGKLLCLHHFLERNCFHGPTSGRSRGIRSACDEHSETCTITESPPMKIESGKVPEAVSIFKATADSTGSLLGTAVMNGMAIAALLPSRTSSANDSLTTDFPVDSFSLPDRPEPTNSQTKPTTTRPAVAKPTAAKPTVAKPPPPPNSKPQIDKPKPSFGGFGRRGGGRG